MTQQTDRERIDTIRQLMQEDYYPPELVVDVAWLLNRLAALEHERDEARQAAAEWRDRLAATIVKAKMTDAQDDLGLTIDMLDVDRLRDWARLLLVHGADIGHWGSVQHVAGTMQILATNIERAIRDIGTWRANRAEHAEAALLSLQRERNELQAEVTGTLSEAFQAIPACYDTPADHYREMARRLVEDRDVQKHRAREAEAALLSLQTAVRELRTRIECDVPRYVVRQVARSDGQDWEARMVVSTVPQPDEYVRWDELAALLPDPAGTPSTKDHEDTFARGDGEQLSDRPRTAPTERR